MKRLNPAQMLKSHPCAQVRHYHIGEAFMRDNADVLVHVNAVYTHLVFVSIIFVIFVKPE